MKCSPTSKRPALLESATMKDEKKRAGRNAFPMFPFRADKEGQMEHWQAFAKKKGWTLSRLIREALDKYTGRKD